MNKSKDNKLIDKKIFSEDNNLNLNPNKIFDKIQKRNEEISKACNKEINMNKNEKDIDTDDTSMNISRMSGMHLEEVKAENLKPVSY